MASYSSGSAKIKIGSAIVIGSNTQFTTYVSANYVFKLTNEGVFYTIAAVYSATKLVLSSRYANTSYQTARTENVASANAATNIYSGTLSYRPVIQTKAVINASERFADDGAGTLTGTQGGTGTIDYDSGLFSITLGKVLTDGYNLSASYFSGDTLTGQSYQIFRDYTPYYRFPEAAPTDQNLSYIYTKSMRMIDQAIHAITVASVKVRTASITNASIQDLTHRGYKSQIVTVATNYSATHLDSTVVFNLIPANKKLTLFTTGAKNIGREIVVVNTSATYDVTATCKVVGDSVEGARSVKLTGQYDAATLRCVKSGLWVVI